MKMLAIKTNCMEPQMPLKNCNPDSITIALFNRGDVAVFSRVYQKLYPAIFNYAKKILTDADEAEDIASETFIKIWNRKSQFENYENIKAFAYIVARNACYNLLKNTNKKMRSHKEILYLTNNQEDRQLMNYEIIKIDIQKELSKQIELLPPQCGQVFKLMYYQGKNSTQVAQEMGITRKTVLNQKLKAQRLIREALEKKSPCGGRG